MPKVSRPLRKPPPENRKGATGESVAEVQSYVCACGYVRIVEETGRRLDDASEGRHYIVDGTDAVAEEVDDVVGVERRCAQENSGRP